MSEKQQAAKYLAQVVGEYAGALRKEGHGTAAQSIAAGGQHAIETLVRGTSEKAPPVGTQGNGDAAAEG